MKTAAPPRAGTLEVQPRWFWHLVLLAVLLALVAASVAWRQDGLNLLDDLVCIAVLASSLWCSSLAAGSLVRSLRAGYALKLDSAGLHIPGLDAVPWSAVRGAELRSYEGASERLRQLVVHTVAAPRGGSLQRFERYLFGPLAGLLGRESIVVDVGLLAVEPESLLGATRSFIARQRQP